VSPMTEDILVLSFVAAAAVYMVVRLRRVAAGRSKCVCGSNSCGPASAPCGRAADADVAGGLPVISPQCNQGGCGRGKE